MQIKEETLKQLYVDENRIKEQKVRYQKAIAEFERIFGSDNGVQIFSAPGRTEVCGNHTDHQRGKVLAASVNLDVIAVCVKTDEPQIRLVSEGYPMITIDLTNLTIQDNEKNTTAALLRGVAAGMKQAGYQIGGFDAYVTSDVLVGAGMSSSAAFESLIGTVFSHLYNDGNVDAVTIAEIGQYAENQYFGKPCGLMDQMACSVGGMIYIDFENAENPLVKQASCNFESAGLSLCIVDTKGSHADLTDDYALVPQEMKAVAEFFGKEVLRQVRKEEFYSELASLREKVCDRAILRAIHFFEENRRVEEIFAALEKGAYDNFLSLVKESGNSSAKYLQNIYSAKDPLNQKVSLALAVSESYLKENGVSRIHGGGFAGTIQAFVRNDEVSGYKEAMEQIFGKESCHVLKIRPTGGCRVC